MALLWQNQQTHFFEKKSNICHIILIFFEIIDIILYVFLYKIWCVN